MSKTTTMLGALAALALSATPALAATLVTPDVANNGNDGVMFDVKVGGVDVTFESLTTTLWGRSARNVGYEIYTYDGGLSGHTDSLAGWTLRYSSLVRIPDGQGDRTLDFNDFTAAADSTVGFYILALDRVYGSVMFADTPGDAVGAVRAGDGAITLLSGYGVGKWGLNTGKSFVGSITYTAAVSAVPEPAAWAMMIVGFGTAGALLRRRPEAVSAA